MDTLKLYKAELKHDRGSAEVYIYASSAESAMTMICKQENCPQRAVKLTEVQTVKL